MRKTGLTRLLAGVRASGQPQLITFNVDGELCWFEDERAIVHHGQLPIPFCVDLNLHVSAAVRQLFSSRKSLKCSVTERSRLSKPSRLPSLRMRKASRGTSICDLRRQNSNPVRIRHIQTMIREQPHWQPIEIHDSLSSMMLLVQARLDSLRKLPSRILRAMFGNAAISVTTYHGGHLRFSTPLTGMRKHEFDLLKMAMLLISGARCPNIISRQLCSR